MTNLIGLAPEVIFIYFLITLFAFTIGTLFGIGSPLILLPALLFYFSPAQSVAIVAVILLAHNITKYTVFRKAVTIAPVLMVGATALPCALVASFFTGSISPSVLKGLIVIIIAYTLVRQYLFKNTVTFKGRDLYFWGTVVGLFSGLTGTAGPPMAIAFRGYGLVLKSFVGTIALLQCGLQLVRLPVYFSTGLMTVQIFSFAVVLAVSSFFSVFIGNWLLDKLDPKSFRLGLDVFLGVIACLLLYSVLA